MHSLFVEIENKGIAPPQKKLSLPLVTAKEKKMIPSFSRKEFFNRVDPRIHKNEAESRVARWYIYFQTKNSNLGKFWVGLAIEDVSLHILWPFGLF
jgi:hypothetical protein